MEQIYYKIKIYDTEANLINISYKTCEKIKKENLENLPIIKGKTIYKMPTSILVYKDRYFIEYTIEKVIAEQL